MAKSKRTEVQTTPDQIRRNIIQWFYELNRSGRAATGMQDLCGGIKSSYDYKAPLVKEHLTYLVDLKYIHKEVMMIRMTTGSTTRDRPKISYRIAAKGIEFVEGRSQFSDKDRYPGININATGGSSVVLGDGNVVNSSFRPVYDELNRLLQAVADSTELNDSAKLEASVNVETIKDQLALNTPDRTIVERAWTAVNKVCTTATLIDYGSRIGPLIASLFA